MNGNNEPNEIQNEDNEKKPYKRNKLELLPESENTVLNIEESKILEKKFGIDEIKEFSTVNLSHLYFYHYKSESVNDLNWGCAWRSLQTVLKYQLSLSNQNKDISFYNLFMKYGDKDFLIEIFKKMRKDKNIDDAINKLKNKPFSPFENDNGWAEPFISQLVLFDFGFDGELILINGYSNNNYAPEEVFEDKIDFNKFKEKLKSHFMQKNPAPIIIDDSYVSVCIIGVKFNKENCIELLIMDPHGAENYEKGLYITVITEEGITFDIKPEKAFVSLGIFFINKKWMAYFPKTN